MLEKTRLAVRRLLTMSNLFENLTYIYGDREVLSAPEPPGYRVLTRSAPGCRDCLRFTNLAAEAFIRDHDLKKGERVLVLVSDGHEFMLIAAALMKAGAIVVPAGGELPQGEIADRASGCGATLAVVDAGLLARRPELIQGIRGVQRLVAAGPRRDVPAGVPSLDEAMDDSSGFFLPYTLKTSNVVGLFHTVMGDGALKAVMATNEALLGPHLHAAPLLPARTGDLCVHAMGLETTAGFCAAVLGLCMGLRMRFVADMDAQGLMETIEDERPRVVMASSNAYPAMLDAKAAACDLSSVRLWIAAGEPLPRRVPDDLVRFSHPRRGAPRTPALFVETYGAGGNASVLAMKPALRWLAMPEGYPGLVIPPNRVKVVDGEGRPLKRGGEGELAIRGPAVTPGYWNDVEGTLEAKRDGWLHTGIRASRNGLFITLR